MQRRRLVPVLAVSVMATLAPGLAAAGPAAAAPAAPTPVAGPLDQYTQQKPAWKRCATSLPAAFQCATIKVPLDYQRPDGKKLDIAISRIRTSDPAKRHGVLLFNPGGPGGSGLADPLAMSEDLPRSVTERFDLIGFDPRGVGRSSPVACGLAADEKVWPRVHRAETYAKDVAWAKGIAEKCRAKVGGEKLRQITTRNTARDMDVLRAVLGEKKISYLGVSYGTALGAVYTQMFPKRADRIVLDSAVDPRKMWRETFQVWAPEVERAYTRWSKWTAARSATYGLGDTPAKVSKTFWGLVAQADRKPILVGKTKYNGAQLRESLRPYFFAPQLAAEYMVLLKEAAAGKPTPEQPRPVLEDNMLSSQFAVLCGDTTWPRDPATYRKDSVRDTKRYPLFGDFASNITPCAFWDKSAEPATTVDNSVGALIIQNEWDSQTPLVTAVGLHKVMKGSKLLTVNEGEGHGVYPYVKNACVDRTASTYLATGKLPSKNVTCQATPQPPKSRSLPTPGLPLTPNVR
ncbi:alpha/beta hydrolase [Streptomyces sp. NPDC020965]|uniref:alpha/beta hydrolase n=1 Tax=Streptomyces sp. NPDC020965 TaxID=3365105 RepID=UPI0037A76BDB